MEIVRFGGEYRERIPRLAVVEIAAPEAGESVRRSVFDKDLDGRQAFALDGPFVETIDREQASLAFLEQRGPELFLVHRLDAGVEGRIFRLKFAGTVPLAPPAGFERLDQPVTAAGDDERRLGRPQIPPIDKFVGRFPIRNVLLIPADVDL